MNLKLLKRSFLDAFGALLYVGAISTLLMNGEHVFGGEKSFLIPIFMLTLLIVSATITGSLVLGKPILMYWDGEKKEAVTLLVATILWLIIFVTIVAMAIMAFA